MSNVAETTRKEALEIINSGQTFDIQFVTCDETRQTGGKRILLSNAVRVGTKHNSKVHRTIGVRKSDNSQHPYAVHIPLITHLNGKRVL